MALHLSIVSPILLIREGLRALLAAEPDFRIAALAPTDDLIDELAAHDADVLLLDVQTLEHAGWSLLAALRDALPTLTIVILGDDAQDRRAAFALRAGARGYLLRDASAAAMAHALRAAHSGTIALDSQIAATLLHAARANKDARAEFETDADADALIEPLSERELDVLRLMTRGLANKQIAAELFISEHTVKFHIRAILGKLGAPNRTAAVTLALSKGLVNL